MTQLELSEWAFALSIISFFVSAASVIVACNQLAINRRHQRLSVKPYLTLGRNSVRKVPISGKPEPDMFGKLHSLSAPGPERTWTLNLFNTGIGPAMIESFEIFVDGTLVKAKSDDKWTTTLKLLFPPNSNFQYEHHFFVISKGYCMAQGGELALLTLTHSDNPTRNEIVAKAINRSRIVIRYSSFYGEPQTYDTDDYDDLGERIAEMVDKASG